jgi:hypothetical protein
MPLLAVAALISVLLTPSPGAGAERGTPWPTKMIVETDRARVDGDFRFRLRVRCEGSTPSNCKGIAYVTTIRAYSLWPGVWPVPIALSKVQRKFEVGKDSKRLMGFRLSAPGRRKLEKRSTMWVRAHIETRGVKTEKPVLLRWRPGPPRR